MPAKQIGIGKLARRMLAEATPLTPLEAAERMLNRTGSFVLARAVYVAHQQADASARPTAKGSRRDAKVSLENRALALLIEHPDWTDVKIAKAVPCARETLYRWTRFQQARAALKAGRESHTFRHSQKT